MTTKRSLATPIHAHRCLPSRLHHNAYVTCDQEANRVFYEEVIGLPLVATWTEVEELWGKERVYCHTFYGLADGSALAFFQFADPADQALYGPKMPETPFSHIALKADEETQDAIEARLLKAGYTAPQTFSLEHGYCRSLYVRDPNGLQIEFTVDPPNVQHIDAVQRQSARAELARWLGGDHTSNNNYRHIGRLAKP